LEGPDYGVHLRLNFCSFVAPGNTAVDVLYFHYLLFKAELKPMFLLNTKLVEIHRKDVQVTNL
jgi:hypothetical protein